MGRGCRQLFFSFLQSHPDAHQTGAHGHVRAAFGIDESADSAGGANLDSPGMELMRRVVAAYWRDYMLYIRGRAARAARPLACGPPAVVYARRKRPRLMV